MKTNRGRFFEHFRIGDIIRHATPRTVTHGDVAVYQAIFGPRFAVQSAQTFAQALGYKTAPVDDLIVFHIVFGKTVPDVSLNAVANLGYAEGQFLKAVYPGDTLSAESEVIGLKENSNGKTGVVYVRTTGKNQHGDMVLSYCRWVMVNKQDFSAKVEESVPALAKQVDPAMLGAAVPHFDAKNYDAILAGAPHRWGDYKKGERIDHADAMTVEEAEHMLATRLWQNTAKVHFDQMIAAESRFGKRLIYGGHVISLARALSFNGLGNAFHIAAINGGRHVAPLFAGGTVSAWSEILDTAEIPGRSDIGALRIRTVATKDKRCADFPDKGADGNYDPSVILDFDYWAVMVR